MDHCRILLATMLVAMNMFFSNSRVGSLDNIHIDIHNPTLTPLSDQWQLCGRHGPWSLAHTWNSIKMVLDKHSTIRGDTIENIVHGGGQITQPSNKLKSVGLYKWRMFDETFLTSWLGMELTPPQRATAPLTLTMVTHEADGRVITHSQWWSWITTLYLAFGENLAETSQ